MTDDLDALLRAADPMNTTDPGEWSPSRLTELMEATMNEENIRHRRYWPVLAAAAAVAALAVGGVAVANSVGDGSGPAGTAAPAPMKLAVQSPGSGPSLGTCIVFSVANLAEMPVAFSGTVADIGQGTVLLEVDHWYRGGDAAQVELTSPDLSRIALDGAITFENGQRYLVTATNGVVNGCGYTAVWSPAMAADFDAAFN